MKIGNYERDRFHGPSEGERHTFSLTKCLWCSLYSKILLAPKSGEYFVAAQIQSKTLSLENSKTCILDGRGKWKMENVAFDGLILLHKSFEGFNIRQHELSDSHFLKENGSMKKQMLDSYHLLC